MRGGVFRWCCALSPDSNVGTIINHRTGTNGGSESFLFGTLGVWESHLNY